MSSVFGLKPIICLVIINTLSRIGLITALLSWTLALTFPFKPESNKSNTVI